MFIIFGFLIHPIYAEVKDIQITPSNPKVGDTITLTGKANPNEDIKCKVWFEVTPIISPPYYGYIMNNVEIPTLPNNFKVIGENVNDLSVSVKMGIWITKSAKADKNGVAIVSQSNVPVGTYDIKIGGTIKNQSKPVKLKIIASTTIKADENGNFRYTYKVNNIPAGTVIHLNIGGIYKDILIRSDLPSPPEVENTTTQTNTKLETESQNINVINNNSNNSSTEISNKEYEKIENKDVSENNINLNKVEKENLNNSLTINKITETTNNSKPVTNINNLKERENIIEGTIIKNIGKNAKLIIYDGTRVSKEGEIQIREITLPNVTLAYYISPKDAEFSIPLILKIKIEQPQNKEIKVLYYDDKLKSWISIPYIVDEENNIVIKINKSGYYAIEEKEINVNKEPIYIQVIGLIKVIINLIKTTFSQLYFQ
ncbi:hypothetical protein ACO3TA_02890 [Methanocaldococcus sp. 28A]